MSQITGLLPTLARADGLKSVDALKQAVNDGTIPGYIGVPMIADLIKKQQQARGMAQQQPTQTVEDQVYAQAEQLQNPQPMPQQMPPQMPQQMPPQMPPPQQPMPQPTQLAGITGAQSNLPTRAMAGGGIVAFAGGGLGDEYDPYEDEDNEEYYADIDSKNQIAKMIAQQAESSALTNALMQQSQEGQSGYGYGISPEAPSGSGIRPDAKGIAGIQGGDQARKYNVGNLRPSGFTYPGQVGVSKGGFAMFDSPEAGTNALNQDIGIKLNRGLDTPVKFISVYAPASDKNDVNAYSNNVAKALGIGPNDKIPNTPEAKAILAQAITRQEGAHKATVNFKRGGIVQLAGGGAVAFQTGGSTMAGFELDTPSEPDVISTPDLDTGYTIDPMTGEKMFSGYRARKPLKPPTSQMNVSPSYVSDEDSGPYINGQPPTATGRATTPPTEAQKSAEEDLFRQMQKSFAAREASHKSEKELDNYLAVLQGFLGVAGGDSPYFARNIGTGFTSGIASLANARKQQGLTERGLGREQISLFTAKQSMDRAAEDRNLRKELAGNTLAERYSKDAATQEARKVAYIQKELDPKGIDSIQLKMLRNKKAMGELNEKDLKKLENMEIERKRVETEANRLFPPLIGPNALGGAGWSASIVKAPGT